MLKKQLLDNNGNPINPITSADSVYTNMGANLEEITPIISKWYGEKIIFLGDSITEGYNVPVGDGYVNWVRRLLGCIVDNQGKSGSTIASPGYLPMSTRYSAMSSIADLVVVAGGTNDYGMYPVALGVMSDRVNTTFYGACHVLFAGLLSKYPNATIVCMTPIRRVFAVGDTRDDTTANSLGFMLKQYVTALKEVAEYYSIPVIDLFKNFDMNPNIPERKAAYFLDGIHPNSAGHKCMGMKVASALLTI